MSNTNIKKRQEIEQKVVRHLVRSMKKAGWDAYRVNDGGEVIKTETEKDVMDTVFSVDESWIRFRKIIANGEKLIKVAYIVLGNDGWDCICDHHLSDPGCAEDDFEKVMEAVSAYSSKFE
jgi:hypothetical protein